MITLKDKITLVTGGGAGIGRAIVEAYAELGATVIVAEKNPQHVEKLKKQLDAAKVPNMVSVVDVTVPAQVKALLAEVEKKYQRLDVLVNNVGGAFPQVRFEDEDPAQWEKLHAWNFGHICIVTHAALPLLKRAAPGSSIISLSSIEGYRGYPLGVVYAAYKAAVINFTKSLACELGGDGIRVNCIAPESTETEAVQITASIKDEYRDCLKRWFPLGRYGTPPDIAGAAVYFATSLSAWTTGETLLVDGGALAQGGWRQTRDGRWTNSPIIEKAHRMYGPVRP